jgi:hypothetical protein
VRVNAMITPNRISAIHSIGSSVGPGGWHRHFQRREDHDTSSRGAKFRALGP